MVVRLILKIHKPLFLRSVHFNRNDDTAGVDLIRLLLICKLPFFLKLTHRHKSQIHQTHKLVFPALEDLTVIIQILPVSIFNRLPVISFPKRYLRKLG